MSYQFLRFLLIFGRKQQKTLRQINRLFSKITEGMSKVPLG